MQITIEALEDYLRKRYSGWATEQGLFMKLVEEVGEVAEVLNKRSGAKAPDGTDPDTELGRELYDIIHYAVAIAAINGMDLTKIIFEKDRAASAKYHHDTNLELYLADRAYGDYFKNRTVRDIMEEYGEQRDEWQLLGRESRAEQP